MQLGDLLVIAVYFANLRAKRSLFDYLLALPQVGSDSPCVILGDFNTGCHHIDEPGTILHWADKLEAMSTRGWIDLWRRTHGPDAREFTWVSHVGNGFRLDHAFANPAAAALLDRCDYDHRTRPAISDHSALHLRLENARSRPGISESATQCH
jgi:exonuclease III